MKKNCLFLLITLISLSASFSQENDHEIYGYTFYGTWGIQQYDCYNDPDYPDYFGGALFELDIGKNWKFHYRIEGGKEYFHIPFALPLSVFFWVMSTYNEDDDKKSSDNFLLALIPEGIAYEFKLTPALSLTPHINILGFDYIGIKDCPEGPTGTNKNVHIMGSAGGNVHLNIGKILRITGFAEYRSSWSFQRKGWQLGARLGFRI